LDITPFLIGCDGELLLVLLVIVLAQFVMLMVCESRDIIHCSVLLSVLQQDY